MKRSAPESPGLQQVPQAAAAAAAAPAPTAQATRTEALGKSSRPRKQPIAGGSPALAAKIRGSLTADVTAAAVGAAAAAGATSAHGSGPGAAQKAGDSGSYATAAARAGQVRHPKGQGTGAGTRHSQCAAMAQMGARIRLQWPSDGRFYGCEIVVSTTGGSG
jgi:hypothetical protein